MKLGTLAERECAEAIRAVSSELTETAKSIGGGRVRYASEFFSVLRMDGDSIGKRLKTDQDLIRLALSRFTNGTKKVLGKSNSYRGVLVYAGGDDVLAILPVDTAIGAALRLRAEYDLAFEWARAQTKSTATGFTLSGSITFSHYRNPLASVLRQSTVHLEEVAKEANGRDSLAISVVKPGGIAADWVTAFDGSEGRIATLNQLAKSALGAGGRAGVSGGFFHGFRQKYEPLFVGPDGELSETIPTDELLEPLLILEIRRQFGNQTGEYAVEIARRVKNVMRPHMHTEGRRVPKSGVAFGGGLVARFLSAEGRYDLLENREQRS